MKSSEGQEEEDDDEEYKPPTESGSSSSDETGQEISETAQHVQSLLADAEPVLPKPPPPPATPSQPPPPEKRKTAPATAPAGPTKKKHKSAPPPATPPAPAPPKKKKTKKDAVSKKVLKLHKEKMDQYGKVLLCFNSHS